MEKALWYLLAGTRGAENRVRIVRRLSERPRNANQLARGLDLDYNTVRHHLDALVEHDVVEPGGDEYGKLYFLTDRFERHRETFERIAGATGSGSGAGSGSGSGAPDDGGGEG